MTENNHSITKFQLFFILIQSQIGVGLLSLPNVVQKTAKGDGWISTLFAGVVVQIMLIIYWQLLKRFPTLIYTEITKKILGSVLGKLINLVIYLNFILVGGLATILLIKIINFMVITIYTRLGDLFTHLNCLHLFNHQRFKNHCKIFSPGYFLNPIIIIYISLKLVY